MFGVGGGFVTVARTKSRALVDCPEAVQAILSLAHFLYLGLLIQGGNVGAPNLPPRTDAFATISTFVHFFAPWPTFYVTNEFPTRGFLLVPQYN